MFGCLVTREWNCLGRIRRYGRAGVGVALLEEVCHWGWALRFQKSMPGPVSLCMVPVDQDIKVSAMGPLLGLLVYHHDGDHVLSL